MREISKEAFLGLIRNGDIGLIRSGNPFSWLQNLYRLRMKDGDHRASHGFYMKTPPKISEANGLIIKGDATVVKFIGDKTKCWIFRYKDLDGFQLERMNIYAQSAEVTGGHYSIRGIWEFAKSFVTKKKNWNDDPGVFCTEYTSRIILAGKIPYLTDRDPWEISPSCQLSWFLNEGGKFGWCYLLHYDGEGHYYSM